MSTYRRGKHTRTPMVQYRRNKLGGGKKTFTSVNQAVPWGLAVFGFFWVVTCLVCVGFCLEGGVKTTHHGGKLEVDGKRKIVL